VVILLVKAARGITMTGCEVISHARPFLCPTSKKAKEALSQTQLAGVTLLVQSSSRVAGLAHWG
jgi:hypothetical protein